MGRPSPHSLRLRTQQLLCLLHILQNTSSIAVCQVVGPFVCGGAPDTARVGHRHLAVQPNQALVLSLPIVLPTPRRSRVWYSMDHGGTDRPCHGRQEDCVEMFALSCSSGDT